MPGLFDGMRISTSGIRTFRVLSEVSGQNIANASNKSYTKQEAHLKTVGSIWDGHVFLGQGVEVSEVVRIRDQLLDAQIRNTSSNNTRLETLNEWYGRLQSVYNEPSDTGINSALSGFWDAWSKLTVDPQSLGPRANIIARTDNLASLIRNAYSRIDGLGNQVEQTVTRTVDDINALTKEIGQLNAQIFQIEAGQPNQANDLRDNRDNALDQLSQLVEISYVETPNGMVDVSIGGHPAVMQDRVEKLETQTNPLDATKLELLWEYGERYTSTETGRLGAVLDVRDSIIPDYKANLNSIASTLIEEVNKIYANGVSMNSKALMDSRLGYEALGATSASDPLKLLNPGETGTIYVSFHDADGNVVRSQGVLIQDTDSLSDIANKLNNVRGLNASLLSSSTNDGRLSLEFDTSGTNTLGETGFTISNHKGGYDSSGVLDLLGFSQTNKSTNTSAAAPVLASRDLTELQTILGEPDVTSVMNHPLGLAGTFTINSFDTMTETAGKTDGHLVQQLAIQVTSTDTINTIMAKINALTANYGVAVSLNGGTNQLELTSTAQTDANGELVLAAGTDYLRLSFANDYRSPQVPNDTPPAGYNGLGDNTNLLATLQFNTLFQGSDGSDIAIDDRIVGEEMINAGSELSDSNGVISLALENLQNQMVGADKQFTLGEHYANLISGVGTDVQRTQNLLSNESALMESFASEKDRISGVSLDEELANMILYQRSYEANARMFSTFDQMAQEMLRLIQ